MKRLSVFLVFACVFVQARPAAHDIPSDVRVQIFVKPAGDRLRVIVRAPIAAMNELDWPANGVLLDLSRAEPVLREAASKWVGGRIDLYEEDARLAGSTVVAAMASLPSDTSFDSYERALAHVTGPALSPNTELVASQALLDVLIEYPIQSDRSRFSIATRFSATGLRSVTALRLLMPTGEERAFQIHDDPGVIRLDPRWWQAASRFVVDGFFHILQGTDHLLFLLCLVIPFRRLGPLVLIVTAFTVAHSITLIASAYDMAPGALWFPPLVETLIAVSIVYMALENIFLVEPRRRWLITFAFGLVHGFGFSFALRETLQFAGNHLLTSLVAFNIGVELGQLLVLALVVPALSLLFHVSTRERMVAIVLSAFVAHTGWHWMIDRGTQLSRYRFEWPVFDASFFALALRWVMLAVFLAGVAWSISVFGKRRGWGLRKETREATEIAELTVSHGATE